MINCVLFITVLVADVAKLHHAIIVASIHQWRRCLSACVKARGRHYEHCFLT